MTRATAVEAPAAGSAWTAAASSRPSGAVHSATEPSSVACWLRSPPAGSRTTAIEAHSYWLNRPPVSYGALPGTDDAYLYSPAFAQFLAPLTLLPWHVFLAPWLTALLLRWLTGPLLLLPAVVLFFGELSYGNIHLLLAAAMAVGFRYPWTWSVPASVAAGSA